MAKYIFVCSFNSCYLYIIFNEKLGILNAGLFENSRTIQLKYVKVSVRHPRQICILNLSEAIIKDREHNVQMYLQINKNIF